MKRDWYIFAVCAIAGILLSGCVNKSPERRVSAAIPQQMYQRAERFQKAVGGYSRGISIGDSTRQFYHGCETLLAARCRAAGFTEVYIAVIPSRLNKWFSSYSKDIERLLSAMYEENISCYAQFDCNDLFSSSELDHSGISLAEERTREIVRFNSGRKNGTFDGLEPVILPSILNEKNFSEGLLYHWSETSYGRNGENDQLMQRAIRMMAAIRKAAGGLKVAENITDFYHERTLSQDLTRGQPRYFLKHSDFLIIRTGSGQENQIFEGVRQELKAESIPRSISVRLAFDKDSYGNGSTKIKTAEWESVVDELSRLCRKASGFGAFRGIVIDDYESFERVWLR